MEQKHEFAPAKINLYLHVTGKREDGYHLLDSVAVFAGLADRLTFKRADTLSLSITGPFAPSLSTETDNLVLRAARMLAARGGVPAIGALTLEKLIPVASGVGGGSADAAAALRLLAPVWGVKLGTADLECIAGALGADVPVCLRGRSMRMRGVGEILTPAPSIPSCGLLLINPGVQLATVSVFRARTGDYSSEATLPAGWSTAQDMAASLSGLTNDLETPAMGLVPAIREVLRAIDTTPGCLLSRMSGSGATCFGLFESAAEAQAAAVALAPRGWWNWGGSFGDPVTDEGI